MTRTLACGTEAVLVECADLAEAQAWFAALHEHPEVVEAVLGARTVLLRGEPAVLRRVVAGTRPDHTDVAPVEAREVVVPVVYDGEDLAEVARLTGLSPDEVVAAHTGRTWRVGFSGFAPGFAYLVADPGSGPSLEVPRLARPRTRVPAGAVGLAGEYSGVYPRESPGGWQLIGRTDVTLFDVDRDPPALLQPGAAVRFEVAR